MRRFIFILLTTLTIPLCGQSLVRYQASISGGWIESGTSRSFVVAGGYASVIEQSGALLHRSGFIPALANRPPVFAAVSYTVDENLPAGSVVATLNASDPDGDPLTFSIISGNTGNAFEINAQGELLVLTSNVLDFETNPVFTLAVQVSDGELTAEASVEVALNDVFEPVTSVEVPFQLSLYPNPASDFVFVRSTNVIDEAVLYDLNGQAVKVFDVLDDNLDVLDIIPGMYLLIVSSGQQLHQFKLIIR